ncbi:MAG: SDR family NAD(P)-dependent oxidoreductase [Rhodospirillales bacterium]|nr:SDR family NAD(P)-dependent oxidoreductase [Rhodospirillales bacterium]
MHGKALEMAGKTVLITGGSGGIGRITAQRLAAAGANVIIVGRDAARGAAAVSHIGATVPGAAVSFIAADLSSQQEIRRLAAEVAGRLSRLDVLINNAGAMFGRRALSPDGIEMTFAVNHLAYVLLTHLLLPLLHAAAPARIVNVASRAHQGVRLNFKDLQAAKGYSGWWAYKRSKLANLYFTYELARRLDPARATVNALHPGFVRTDIGVASGFLPDWLWNAVKLAAITPEQGAETSVYLASDPSLAAVTGQYFVKCHPERSSAVSYDA